MMTKLVNTKKYLSSFSSLAKNLTPPLLTERSVILLRASPIGELVLSETLGETKVRLLKKEKINFIEYNRGYIDYAKENRKKSTKVERIFWWMVKNRKFLWYKFRRQKVIWPFILDFYCSELLLWIELDVWYHNNRIDYDRYRDSKISKKWIRVVRFRNEDIEKNIEWMMDELAGIIKKRRKILIQVG